MYCLYWVGKAIELKIEANKGHHGPHVMLFLLKYPVIMN